MTAYYTMDEYRSLMMEAKVEFDMWERSHRRKRRENTEKHKIMKEAKRAFMEEDDTL